MWRVSSQLHAFVAFPLEEVIAVLTSKGLGEAECVLFYNTVENKCSSVIRSIELHSQIYC
jgi:hypothetical protein